jgi:hypothetical protein
MQWKENFYTDNTQFNLIERFDFLQQLADYHDRLLLE